jgi:ribosomal protein S14
MLKTKRSLLNLQKKFFINEYFRKIKKFLFINTTFLNSKQQKNFSLVFSKKSTNKYSKVKLKPICLLSNRSKSVNKYYNISRIKQRDMLSFGIFPGYKKAVW